MNENKYKKKLEFKQNIISHQSKQIEDLEEQVRNLKLDIEEKNKIINSIEPMRNELAQNVAETKKYKEQYKSLIQELRDVKKILTQEVYGSQWKWNLIKFLIK